MVISDQDDGPQSGPGEPGPGLGLGQALAFQDTCDQLTGLRNYTCFETELGAHLEQRHESSIAVLYLDLARFAQVNDCFGIAAGNDVLRVLTRRLVARAQDTAMARAWGDRFLFMLREGTATRASAEALAARLLLALSRKVAVDQHQLSFTGSIGIAFYDGGHAVNAGSLIAQAEIACRRAKQGGRGRVCVFDPESDRQASQRRRLLHDLSCSLPEEQLGLHYQPIATLEGQVVGFEALARWHHPAVGDIPPAAFIPIAEECGMIGALGEWILRRACAEAASWPRSQQIAINISPVQFLSDDIPALVHAILLDTGLDPRRLELEITESSLLSDIPKVQSIIERLKTLGVSIVLDDFGTGHATLSYLRAFSVDKIKIDRSFVQQPENPKATSIIKAIAALGRTLDVKIVAEGAESWRQLELIAAASCDLVQGFLIGKPRPISEYVQYTGAVAVPL